MAINGLKIVGFNFMTFFRAIMFVVMLRATFRTQRGQSEYKLIFLSWISGWCLGITLINLVSNYRFNAFFSTGKDHILLASVSSHLFKTFGGYHFFISLYQILVIAAYNAQIIFGNYQKCYRKHTKNRKDTKNNTLWYIYLMKHNKVHLKIYDLKSA